MLIIHHIFHRNLIYLILFDHNNFIFVDRDTNILEFTHQQQPKSLQLSILLHFNQMASCLCSTMVEFQNMLNQIMSFILSSNVLVLEDNAFIVSILLMIQNYFNN